MKFKSREANFGEIAASLENITERDFIVGIDNMRNGTSGPGVFPFGNSNPEYDTTVRHNRHFMTTKKLAVGRQALTATTLIRAVTLRLPRTESIDDARGLSMLDPETFSEYGYVTLFEPKGQLFRRLKTEMTMAFDSRRTYTPTGIATEGIYRYLTQSEDLREQDIAMAHDLDVRRKAYFAVEAAMIRENLDTLFDSEET